MTGHLRGPGKEVCQYGATHARCRCIWNDATHTVWNIDCPTPDKCRPDETIENGDE